MMEIEYLIPVFKRRSIAKTTRHHSFIYDKNFPLSKTKPMFDLSRLPPTRNLWRNFFLPFDVNFHCEFVYSVSFFSQKLTAFTSVRFFFYSLSLPLSPHLSLSLFYLFLPVFLSISLFLSICPFLLSFSLSIYVTFYLPFLPFSVSRWLLTYDK